MLKFREVGQPDAQFSGGGRLCSQTEILDFDIQAAAHTGQIRAELAQAGTPVGPYDQMIAGHARSRGLIIVTDNRRKFERVPGLRVEDWTV